MDVLYQLRQFPILASLTPQELDELAHLAEMRAVPKHTFIYMADEPSDYLCFLVQGSVKVGIYTPDGREIVRSFQHPYTIFGEMGLSGESKRAEFASSMNQNVRFISIKTADFRPFLERNFMLAQAMFNHLGERVRRAERHWESLLCKDVRSRIVDFLKETAFQRGRQVGFETLLKHGFTQQDLANLIGASRQTVTSILNELRKSNLIYFNRTSILIRDLNKLN
ncbi:MAG: Crp/Fnr family transcriptional regulator [Saprospiraceae bacterium]|nr:Crp/Fnr family transcriptional regulator [Saprospiraceae bacterium]MDW8483499.1 Crp/Fnr family transcriptional regulator [Saprospiraceae bacterium]